MRFLTWVSLIVAAIILAAAAAPVGAQGCGKDPLYPCGPIPWPIPAMPSWRSPTPYPIRPTPTLVVETPTPSETPTPTATQPYIQTPDYTPGNPVIGDVGDLSGDMADAVTSLDMDLEINLNGTAPAPVSTLAADLANYTSMFFGYAKGLTLFNMRGAGGVMTWVLIMLSVVLITVVVTNMLPVIMAIWRLFIRMLELIAEWIPF
jgi:hypothetical protein